MKIQDLCDMMPCQLANTIVTDVLEDLAALIFWF